MPAKNKSGLLVFFHYKHLPEHLQVVSKQYHDFAWHLEEVLPEGSEKTVALRKLLESKDAAVRSAVVLPN